MGVRLNFTDIWEYGVVAAAALLAVLVLCFLLHKGQKGWRRGCLVGIVLCIAYLVWFYLPYQLPTGTDALLLDAERYESGRTYSGELTLAVSGTEENRLSLTEEEGRRLVELCNQLWFQRSILSVPRRSTDGEPGRLTIPPGDHMTLSIYRPSGQDLRILCAMGRKGFAGREGVYCLTLAGEDRVYGWEPLVEYLKELADKYEIPLAE